MLKDVTVLITAAGNVFMPGTTKCIKENGERNIRLIGADMNDDPSILRMCDAYYPVPRGDDLGYVSTLLEICKKESVDVVLPIMSVELEALSKDKERFEEQGTIVSVSDYEPLLIANDKLRLFEYLRENGLPCAGFFAVHNMAELRAAVRELGYGENRVCVKATHGSGSRGFRILDAKITRFDRFMHDKPNSDIITLEEMITILEEAEIFPELLVMEYLPGAEYTVDLLADKGKVIYNCCRKSLRMDNSIMLDSLVTQNKDVLALCEKVTVELGLDGNIGFDIRERKDGTPVIMECNPRITAGIPVFSIAGVNLPYLNIKRLLGEDISGYKLEEGLVVRRRWMEMI